MAKPDTIYSLFGMKTPQEVAAEEFKKRFSYQPGPSGYQRAGAGLGQLLGALFSPESEQMKQAKMDESLLSTADLDFERQRRMEEAEATARTQAEVDARYQRAQAAAGTESVVDEAPTVQQTPLSPEDQAVQGYMDNARRFTFMAERLSAAGRTEAAMNARKAAQDEMFKGLSAKKMIAETQKAALGAKPQYKEFKEGDEIVTYQIFPDGRRVEVSRADRYKPEGTDVNVTVDKTTQNFLKSLGGTLSTDYSESLSQTKNAFKNISVLDRMDRLINSGEVITGVGADFIKNATKVLNKLGLTDSNRPAATEEFFASSAALTMSLLKTGALGTGQSITQKDKEFMQEVSGNKISLDENAIRRINRINRQVTAEALIFHNMLVDDIKTSFPEEDIRLRKVDIPYDRLGLDQAINEETGEIIYRDPVRDIYVRADGTPVPLNNELDTSL